MTKVILKTDEDTLVVSETKEDVTTLRRGDLENRIYMANSQIQAATAIKEEAQAWLDKLDRMQIGVQQ